MKRCPQCAEKIQDAALVCRFCGKAQPPSEGGKGTLVLVCIGVVVIVALFNQITGKADKPQTATSENTRADSTEAKGPSPVKVQLMALRRLEALVRDPDSMETRNLHVPAGAAYLCGEVNGANAFGGMTGYVRFMAGAHSAMPVVIEGDRQMRPEEFEKAWGQMC